MPHCLPRFVPTFGAALVTWIVGAMPVAAAGLGAGDAAAVLGRPLDFAVAVRLDAGEQLTPECVAAAVNFGDRRVPPPLVRVLVEPTSASTVRLRVQTQSTVDEPVLSLELSAGCTNRITRRYVVLADPPGMAYAAPAAVPAQALQPAAVPASASPEVAAQAPAAAASPAPGALTAEPAGSPAPMPAAASASPGSAPALERPARPVLTPEQVAERERRRVAARAERAARQARQRAARERAAQQRAAAQLAATPPGPRLQLEPLEPASARSATAAADEAVAQAMAAVASAASAARQAAEAASAQEARIATLEQELALMRREAQASNDLAGLLRQRLAEAERGSRWTAPLALASVLLAFLAAWLAWRLGRSQASQRAQWQQAAAAAPGAAGATTSATAMGLDDPLSTREPTSPAPFVTASNGKARGLQDVPRTVASPFGAAPPAPALARGRSSPAWPPPAPPVAWPPPVSTLPPDLPSDDLAPTQPLPAPDATTVIEPPMQRTEALPGGGRNVETAPRDVSIEELIDLEQQAEFFMVLGQEEAAVDLLVEHLRSTGGGSPLPYLKLLEVHQRRGDHEAYERMRQRFNHRFNAYAPEWGVDLTSGRTLEDYAGVIPRLQQVWPRPLDAMAELEALLFRKSRGELFDLPAYREVLFLYALARDLLDRAAIDTSSVDLLLPMSDGTEFGSTAPSPYIGLDRDAFKDTMPPEDMRPTAPLDLDVTGDRPTSIFDLLDQNKPRPR
jgi:pilus assembly protein FimV